LYINIVLIHKTTKMKGLILAAALALTACGTKQQNIIDVQLMQVDLRCSEYFMEDCLTRNVDKKFKIKNNFTKDIRAVSFKVQYLDILGDQKGEKVYSSTSNAVEAGDSTSVYFTSFYTQYDNLNYFLANTKVKNIRTKTTLLSVLFADGTSINK
jgi:outer membrane lipopolysaccharide assembly protein LptE/RlpB